FMSAAFSATNQQEKEKLFVAAWRSLGETMHLLADMTVPAHVRNDSHPGASFEKYRADPYESRINQENVNDVHQNQVDPSLLQTIQSIPENQDGFLQVLQLFDIVAGYTNRNYFSLDTIAGVEKMLEQTITNANGMPEYPTPRLENQEVDENGYYYRTDYLGKLYLTRIQYQKQESFLEKVKYTPIPEVDEQCALSQAKRLIPAAITGNEKLVEWFVPRIEIIIDSLTIEKGEDEIPRGVIQGRVIHTPSGMYDQPLLYSLPPDMPVKIVIDGKPYDLPAGAISIQQGVIEGTIAPMPEGTWKQVGLILDIGGLTVVSKGTPIASLELQPKVVEGTVGEAYGWYVQTIDAPSGVIYRWDLGDGTVEKTEEVSLTHVYSEEGQYRISVEMKDAKTGKTLATAIGKAIITPKPEPEETPTPEPIPTPEEFVVEETPTPEPTPSPAPTMNEEQRRQDILAEYRALYPQSLRAFHKFGRVEVIANADEVGSDQYHVAYKLWQIIEDGPRKGEEYEAVSLDLIFNLGQLEADLPIMRKNLGIEK
ncbi:MAG: PKD domain-containing protein, partial [Atribacterota bacterium]